MKVKTKDLIGAALDWAVAVALGLNIRSKPSVAGDKSGFYAVGDSYNFIWREVMGSERPIESYYWWCPSENWRDGGPLIDQFKVGIEQSSKESYAYIPGFDLDGFFAKATLVAICRAVVAHKLGEEVEVPDELVKAGLNEGEGR